MKTISLLLLSFVLILVGCSEPDDLFNDESSDLQLKSAKNKNRTVVTHKVLEDWGLPVVCDPNDDPLGPNPDDQLCTCDGEQLYLTTRTHYDKNGAILWQHKTFSGSMKSELTGQIFKIPEYTMKWYYTEANPYWPTSWDLHFTAIGEWGTKYVGAGTLNFQTMEGKTLRVNCINYIEPPIEPEE